MSLPALPCLGGLGARPPAERVAAAGGEQGAARASTCVDDPAVRAMRALIARAPASANLILALPQGVRVLESPESRDDALAAISNALASGSAAWDALAQALRLPRQEAILAVGGGTVAVFARADNPLAGLSSWALVASVTPDTRARLQSALALSPREVLAGQPVLSVENGRYVLALRPAPPGTALPEPARSEQLLLAPADDAGIALLRGVLLALDAAPAPAPLPPETAEVAPALASLDELPPAWAFALVRDDPGPTAERTYRGWGTHRVIAFAGDDRSATFTLRLRDASLPAVRAQVPRVPAAALEPAWSRAIVGYFQAQSAALPASMEPWTLSIMDDVNGAPPAATARLMVMTALPRASAAGGAEGGESAQAPGIAVMFSLQCPGGVHAGDSVARLDRAMKRAGGNIEALAGAGGEGWDAVDALAALAPEARREITIDLPERGQGAAILGAHSVAAWSVVPALGTPLGAGWDAWMHVTLGAEGQVLPGPPSLPVAYGATSGSEARQWVSRMVVRMPRVQRALPALVGTMMRAPMLAAGMNRENMRSVEVALQVVDEVTWDCWLDERVPDVAVARLHTTLDVERARALHAQRARERAPAGVPTPTPGPGPGVP